MRFFGKPHQVKRRASGTYVAGRYTPGAETVVVIDATVQPSTMIDYDQAKIALGGSFPRQLRKVYTDSILGIRGEDGEEGDRIVCDSEDWIVIGGSTRDILNSSVSHNRYLIVPLRELTVQVNS